MHQRHLRQGSLGQNLLRVGTATRRHCESFGVIRGTTISIKTLAIGHRPQLAGYPCSTNGARTQRGERGPELGWTVFSTDGQSGGVASKRSSVVEAKAGTKHAKLPSGLEGILPQPEELLKSIAGITCSRNGRAGKLCIQASVIRCGLNDERVCHERRQFSLRKLLIGVCGAGASCQDRILRGPSISTVVIETIARVIIALDEPSGKVNGLPEGPRCGDVAVAGDHKLARASAQTQGLPKLVDDTLLEVRVPHPGDQLISVVQVTARELNRGIPTAGVQAQSLLGVVEAQHNRFGIQVHSREDLLHANSGAGSQNDCDPSL